VKSGSTSMIGHVSTQNAANHMWTTSWQQSSLPTSVILAGHVLPFWCRTTQAPLGERFLGEFLWDQHNHWTCFNPNAANNMRDLLKAKLSSHICHIGFSSCYDVSKSRIWTPKIDHKSC
jgi:hypothetical protein